MGSTAFHPFESCLLSASGSQHFIDEGVEELEDDLSDLGCQYRRFIRWGRGLRFSFSSKGKRCPSREAASSCHVGFHAEVVECRDALSKRQFWNFYSASIIRFLEFNQPATITYGRLNIHPQVSRILLIFYNIPFYLSFFTTYSLDALTFQAAATKLPFQVNWIPFPCRTYF